MIPEPRRAAARFALLDAGGKASREGEGEALIGDDALAVGASSVSFLDVEELRAGDHRIELELWPEGRLVLTQLGRRYDTFLQELGRARNQARVAGLLAHGITLPEVFDGALLGAERPRAAEFQLYETHVTIVPAGGDPWQLPLGALSGVTASDDPPAIVLDTAASRTVVGLLARRRDAFQAALAERREAQRRLLARLTGQDGFSDGQGRPRGDVRAFDELLARFTTAARTSARDELLALAGAEPRLGFVQLLDPDGERLASPEALPDGWAAFLLVPARELTVLEILAGPAAATYVFRAAIESVNRDLQALHFRRAPLALTAEQARVTPDNPHRLALRKLEPLLRLRASATARLVHDEGWSGALRQALAS